MALRMVARKINIDKKYLLKKFIDEGMSAQQIADELGIHNATVYRRLRDYGMSAPNEELSSDINSKTEGLGELEKKTLNELNKAGYSLEDIKEFIQGMQKSQSNLVQNYTIGKNYSKHILFGDPHIGNIQYDSPLMKLLAKVAKKEKVDFVACTGDIFDGWYQNRPSSIFEQNAIGFDQQMKLAVEELSQLEVPLLFITGNHSYNTFVRGAGVEAGPYLEDKLNAKGMEAKYLGNADGTIKIGKSILRLLHPDGGTAYALSYKPQKIIESMESGHKPNVLAIGHFHKADYMFYRNVHCFQTATLCGQTKFMKGKGLAAHKGFWLVEMYTKSDGQIDCIIPRLYPAYK